MGRVFLEIDADGRLHDLYRILEGYGYAYRIYRDVGRREGGNGRSPAEIREPDSELFPTPGIEEQAESIALRRATCRQGNRKGGTQATVSLSPAIRLCRELLDDVLSLEGIDCGAVYLVRESDGALVLVAHRRLSRKFRDTVKIISLNSPMAEVMCGAAPYYIRAENSKYGMYEIYRREKMRSIAVIPLWCEGRAVGSLNLASRTLDSLSRELRASVEKRVFRFGCAFSRLSGAVLPLGRREVKLPPADVVVTLDGKGRIVEADSAFRNAFADMCDDPIGMHAWSLISMKGSWKPVLEKLLKPPYRSAFVTEATAASGAKWFLWDCRAVQDGSGNVSGFHLTGKDITEMLIGGERLLAVLGAMDNASSVILLVDEDLNILFMNKKACACLLQWNGSRGDRPAHLDGLFPALSDSAREELRRAVLDGEVPREIVFRTPAGEKKKMVFLSTNVFTGCDANVSYLLVGRIIGEDRSSDGRDSEEEVYARIGRASSRILHEVKTPLTSISINIDLLALELAEDDRCTEPLRIIRSEIQRLRRIVKYGLEDVREAFSPVRIALREIIEEAASPFRVEFLERNITFRNLVGTLAIYADRHMMVSAIRNLVKNALEAVGNGGNIEIFARKQAAPGTAECDIVDDGCGVADPVSLFKPFQSTKPNGTGLGLVHARRICELHGGDLKLAESRPGRTVFTIVLPAAPEGV
ncbi:MAG: ATP-binding protein [Bacteroidota bacterium]|nr:ATP-binding protein [Bacteroidota bacterium]